MSGPKWAIAAARRRQKIRQWAIIAVVAVAGVVAGLAAASAYGYIDHRSLSLYRSAEVDGDVSVPEVGLGGFKVLEDPHSNYTCTGGWQPTVNCDPFATVNVDGVLACDELVPHKLSGYCQCSHGLIARREGCGGPERLEFTCTDQCDNLNRESIHNQRAAREASAVVQRMRAGWWRKHLGGGKNLREGDLQAMSNTAKCQLSRAVHKGVGMADDMRVVENAAIEDDFRPWRHGYTRADIWKAIEKARMRNVLAVWEVKDGKIKFADRINTAKCAETPRGYWGDTTDCVLIKPNPETGTMEETGRVIGIDRLLYILMENLNRGIDEGDLKPPEGLQFLISVEDDSMLCQGGPDDPPSCVAPWLSHIRRNDMQEILVPVLHGVIDEPFDHPWEEKSEIAFWHGTDFCRPHPLDGHWSACARTAMTELSWRYPDMVNLTNQRQVPQMFPEKEHSSFKYLVQLDGISASYRWMMLMHTNSVTLKQDSPWSEYWYRFVRPCIHYIPFFTRAPDDLIDEVAALRLADDYAKEVAANSQAFAMRHLGRKSRLRYWQKLLDTYAELQTDFPPPPETAQNAAAEAPQAAAAPAIAAAQEQPAATKAEGGIGDKAAVDVAAEAAALSEGKTATETNSAAAAEEGAPADAGNAAKVTEAAA